MSFIDACADATIMAKWYGKRYFVYETTRGDFMTSHQYDRDWLFQAYPGGMKVLSVEGQKVRDRALEWGQ